MAAASSPSAAAAADAIKQLEALEERACSLLTSASAVVTTLSQAHAVPGAEAKAKAHIDEFGAQLQSIVLPLRAEIKRVAAGKKELVENMQRR